MENLQRRYCVSINKVKEETSRFNNTLMQEIKEKRFSRHGRVHATTATVELTSSASPLPRRNLLPTRNRSWTISFRRWTRRNRSLEEVSILEASPLEDPKHEDYVVSWFVSDAKAKRNFITGYPPLNNTT